MKAEEVLSTLENTFKEEKLMPDDIHRKFQELSEGLMNMAAKIGLIAVAQSRSPVTTTIMLSYAAGFLSASKSANEFIASIPVAEVKVKSKPLEGELAVGDVVKEHLFVKEVNESKVVLETQELFGKRYTLIIERGEKWVNVKKT